MEIFAKCDLCKRRVVWVMLFSYILGFYIFYSYYYKKVQMTVLKAPSGGGQAWHVDILNALIGQENDDTDIHVEDAEFGHTGETLGRWHLSAPDPNSIGIGLGITSRGIVGADKSNIKDKFQFFSVFLPTFCATASKSYNYSFYLAYDHTDDYFIKMDFDAAFVATFTEFAQSTCRGLRMSIHLVQCSHARKPAWAQNDAMLEAYLDNMEYYYRVNDDTRLLSPGWADAFVETLASYAPTNIGVVGPNHSGGNTAILTYDFVNKRHVEIFGFYYPRLFSDWWGDDWVTRVYEPGRSMKRLEILLAHTQSMGQRYNVNWEVGKQLAGQIEVDRLTLNRYIKYHKDAASNPQKYVRYGRKVIAISLFGRNPRYSWGAIRLAQTIAIYYPGWSLRVYVCEDYRRPVSAAPHTFNTSSQAAAQPALGNSTLLPRNASTVQASQSLENASRVEVTTKLSVIEHLKRGVNSDGDETENNRKRISDLAVPPRFLHKLQLLGADIVRVPHANLMAKHWRYLVLDDTSVDTFLIRNADQRFSIRETALVEDWLRVSSESNASSIHCIRDHPSHVELPVADGLWGGSAEYVRERLDGWSMQNILERVFATEGSHRERFLADILWPILTIEGEVLCHDSVCGGESATDEYVPFPELPTERENGPRYVGQRFDDHQLADPDLFAGVSVNCKSVMKTIGGEERTFARQFLEEVPRLV